LKQGKVWGDTENIFSSGITTVHFINVKKGGFCSEHLHRHKTNKFYVISGELEISIWQDKDTCDKTILKAGQSTIVPFGVWHKFKGLTETQCIEIYEVKFAGEDISRRTIGGVEK